MRLIVPLDIEDQRVIDLITSALEGGSNYWYIIDISQSRLVDGVEFLVEQPMKDGILHIELLDPDEGPINYKTAWRLSRASAEAGLVIMATKYPAHFADFLAENDDAITGDVFLQCALFGEVVFG